MSFQGFHNEPSLPSTPHLHQQSYISSPLITSSFSSLPESSPPPAQTGNHNRPNLSHVAAANHAAHDYPLLNIIQHGQQKMVKYPEPSDLKNGESLMEAIEEFNNWWSTTQSAVKLQEKKKRVAWGGDNHCSPVWKDFVEIALLPIGNPHVCCKHCHALLTHPAPHCFGTKGMSHHLQSNKCSFAGDSSRETLGSGKKSMYSYFAKDKEVY